MQKYYRILDLPYDAPLPEIKQAYRDLVRIWHPDRYTRDERLQKRATLKLMEINEAYKMLCSITPSADQAAEPEEAEPIDWSRPGSMPAPKDHSFQTARKEPKPQQRWGYAAVPVCVSAILIWSAVSFSEPDHAANPLPPPDPDLISQLAIQTRLAQSSSLQTDAVSRDTVNAELTATSESTPVNR
ncbi:MAG: J domain-containing protein [Bacteroidetes bacterium]|nr:J domain-containing protein [Bacteroidota bacterium]MCW5895934.1 J domain-containing protein [Bacteroidota bacterium]